MDWQDSPGFRKSKMQSQGLFLALRSEDNLVYLRLQKPSERLPVVTLLASITLDESQLSVMLKEISSHTESDQFLILLERVIGELDKRL
jgi:hypothetical protein